MHVTTRYLGVLGLGNVDEDLGGGMDNIEQLHNGGAVVGNGDISFVVVDEFVHASGTQGGSNDVGHRSAGVDVADQLCLPLRRVGPLLQQYDLRLQHGCHFWRFRSLNREREREGEGEGELGFRLGFVREMTARITTSKTTTYRPV
uniref:T-complex protein 1 subunit eta-like n=1 Tax=Rhizophora mucronata TaxID=61149 RepID=A0A2P2MIZ6_RHIMU